MKDTNEGRLSRRRFTEASVRAAAEKADISPSVLRLVLGDIAGTPYASLAEENNIPIGTVRSRLHRAKARLLPVIKAAAEQPATGDVGQAVEP